MAEQSVQEILQKLERIDEKLDNLQNTRDDHECRLRLLEGRSGKRWDGLVAAIITAVVGLVVGLALGNLV